MSSDIVAKGQALLAEVQQILSRTEPAPKPPTAAEVLKAEADHYYKLSGDYVQEAQAAWNRIEALNKARPEGPEAREAWFVELTTMKARFEAFNQLHKATSLEYDEKRRRLLIATRDETIRIPPEIIRLRMERNELAHQFHIDHEMNGRIEQLDREIARKEREFYAHHTSEDDARMIRAMRGGG